MKNRLLPLGLILLLAALLAPVFRNFVREVIVIPLLYVFWIGRFIFEAIPQVWLWSACFAVFLMILGIGLLGKQKVKPKTLLPVEANEGRVLGWAKLIRRAEQDDYFKWRLAQHLQKVTLNAIAHHQGQSLKQTRQQLRQGKLDMPPELQAYFQASLQSLGHLPPPKRFFNTKTTTPLDLDPMQVVQFLEDLNSD